MENGKKFKTNFGYCHILPDKIVLTRNGILGNIAKVTIGNSIQKISITYGLLSLIVFYFAFEGYKNGQTVEPLFLGLIGLALIYGVYSSVKLSATQVIERNRITEVKLKKAFAGLTRTRFEVMFEDDNGKLKKRIIMLPGSLLNEQKEINNALKIMSEEKIEVSA